MFYNFLLFLFFVFTNAKDYKAVDELDVNMYTGKWYEVYEDNFDKLFQGMGRCATAEYELLNNGNISVFNKQIDVDNKIDTIAGVAYYNDDNCCGYLTVELVGQMPAPYWVLELGPVINNQYQYSIVSDNIGLSLFVLARNVDEFFKEYDNQVLESLKEYGFINPLNYPIKMVQNNCSI